MSGTLTFDVETHSRRYLYSMPPEEFVRLIGYAWGDGPVQITTDLGELRAAILKARWIIGHNIHDFDLRAVFGFRSNIPMRLADEGRVYDTWTHAALVNPAPATYVNRYGKKALADKPEKMLAWFGLDEQAYQLGVPGKTHDLKELAHEYGDPELPKKARIEDGFGRIPVDDDRYRRYLIGDVEASRAVGRALLHKGPLDQYAMREQRIESRKACISSNGWRLDEVAARARTEHLRVRRDEIMAGLIQDYGFPEAGEKPWLTNPGKDAVLAVLRDHGITPQSRPDWPRTPGYSKLREAQANADACRREAEELRELLELERSTLKERTLRARQRKLAALEEKAVVPEWFGLSLSGDTLTSLTKGTPVQDLGEALAELMGQRSLSELAVSCVYPDGFVHPEITMLQRSGRWSTTEPGLTIWTSRGEGAIEKSYFLPDAGDHVLIEIDLSNADARAVAAMSGDKEYAVRFEPGADGHLLNAWAAWGKDIVGTDKKDPKTAEYRQMAKPLGHGWSYGGRAKTLSAQAGVPLKDAETFVDGMDTTYKVVVGWQNKVRKYANRHGYVQNPWGRKMWIEKGREFTQAPALMGQSVTREIVCDALLAMSHEAMRSVKAQIHDALVFSVPADGWETFRDYLKDKMETVMSPPGGQRIEFPADCGPPGENWMAANH
ncbi:DNA polymerase [Actinomadura oligospora]|uniref:DNA polymerase n=1 Tax=Actinomadura oligospora TaxID=111804 RepID=UPI0004B4CAA2|nr:DNA polymerase [Actinomadura oligospora]